MGLLGMAGKAYWAFVAGKHDFGAKTGKIPWFELAGYMMRECRKVGYFSPDDIRVRGAGYDKRC